MSRAGWLGFVFAVLMAGSGVSALAQDNVMKICGDKWRVAKESSATSGQTWMQFLAKCRTETAAIVAPAASSKPVASIAETPAPASEKPAVATAPGKPAVYPGAIASKFASEKPYRARQKTCSEPTPSAAELDARDPLGAWTGQGTQLISGSSRAAPALVRDLLAITECVPNVARHVECS